MRRSQLLKVTVHCPHFRRTVTASRNTVIDRLVACDHSDACRAPEPEGAGSPQDPAKPYPHGCPVFPQLAK